MKKLEDYKASWLIDYLAMSLIEAREGKGKLTKALAKKVILNAISYNVVVNEIMEMSEHLLDTEERKD